MNKFRSNFEESFVKLKFLGKLYGSCAEFGLNFWANYTWARANFRKLLPRRGQFPGNFPRRGQFPGNWTGLG